MTARARSKRAAEAPNSCWYCSRIVIACDLRGAPFSPRAAQVVERRRDAGVQNLRGTIELIGRGGEGRHETQHAAAAPDAEEQAALECVVGDRPPGLVERRLAFALAGPLDPLCEPAAADIADHLVPGSQRLEVATPMLADVHRPLRQVPLHD